MQEKLKQLYNILFCKYAKTTITVLVTAWACAIFCNVFAMIVMCATAALNIFQIYAVNEGWNGELE